MKLDVDAVVIGAGINGLVAAAELAKAGWSVALVDGRDRIGGFIASDELTRPGYVHDTYSSWHPLFIAGPAYAVLGERLHEHGLEYCNTDGTVTASVSARGTVLADRDPESTFARFEKSADRAAYQQMLTELDERSASVFGVLSSSLSGSRLAGLGAGALRGLGARGTAELMRVALQSGRAFTRERFSGWEVDQLWSPWLLHAGLSPDHASGGLMLPVMAATMHGLGLPVVRGGAGQFIAAFEALLEDLGVRVLLGTPADRIEVRDGRATIVHLGGSAITARRAVLASTSTTALYDDLLDRGDVPATGRRAARQHRPGRAAMQVHLALDRPVGWTDARLDGVPLVHVSDGSDSTGMACAQAEAGLLPTAPSVVVGQQSVLDPSRAPDGAATLWLQLQEVPFSPRGDAGGEIDTTSGWDTDTVAAYVERVIARVENHAPGLGATIVGQSVISPVDLSAANPNAIQGDPYGGAAELDQSLRWRPGTGTGHRTGVQGLWHLGAFTHPGPGLGAGSGHLVAQQLLSTSRVRAGARRLLERLSS